jgi:hypothetical protein
MHHVYSNEEVARSRGVSQAAVGNSGRLLSFGVDFLPFSLGLPDVFSSVVVYRSAQQAAADVPALVAFFKAGASGRGATNVRDFPASVGQSSAGYIFDATPGGTVTTYLILFAQSGRYVSQTIVVDDSAFFPETSAVALALNLAGTMDRHIQEFG